MYGIWLYIYIYVSQSIPIYWSMDPSAMGLSAYNPTFDTHILQRKNYGINSIIHLHLSYAMFAGSTRPATTRRRQASPPNFLKSTTGHSRISDLCIDPVTLSDYFLLDLGALFLQPWCSFEAWVHQHGARSRQKPRAFLGINVKCAWSIIHDKYDNATETTSGENGLDMPDDYLDCWNPPHSRCNNHYDYDYGHSRWHSRQQ